MSYQFSSPEDLFIFFSWRFIDFLLLRIIYEIFVPHSSMVFFPGDPRWKMAPIEIVRKWNFPKRKWVFFWCALYILMAVYLISWALYNLPATFFSPVGFAIFINFAFSIGFAFFCIDFVIFIDFVFLLGFAISMDFYFWMVFQFISSEFSLTLF